MSDFDSEYLIHNFVDIMKKNSEHFPSYINATPARIERGLTSKDWYVRLTWAIMVENLTIEQLERGLHDTNSIVQKAFVDKFFNAATVGKG